MYQRSRPVFTPEAGSALPARAAGIIGHTWSSFHEILEIRSKQPRHAMADIFPRNGPAIFRHEPVGVREDGRESTPRIAPLIDHLLEHPGVGMLGNEHHPEHLYALTRDLF